MVDGVLWNENENENEMKMVVMIKTTMMMQMLSCIFLHSENSFP